MQNVLRSCKVIKEHLFYVASGKAKALEASRCYLSVSQMLLDNSRWYTRGCFPFFHCCIYKVCCKNSFFRMSKAVAVFQEIQDPQESHLCNLFVVMVVPVRGIQSLDCFKKRFQSFRTCGDSTGGGEWMAHVGRDPHSGGCLSTINNYFSRHFQTHF